MVVDSLGCVHCVGSFPVASAEESFAVAGPALKGLVKRLPDGEAHGWRNFASDVLEKTIGIERYVGEASAARPWMTAAALKELMLRPQGARSKFRLAKGYKVSDIDFAPIGYDEIVLKSYAAFCAARERGDIAADTRFLASFPTPFAVVFPVFEGDVPAMLERYEARLFQELRNVFSKIPAKDLAIQWDVALEIVSVLERKYMPEAAERFSVDDIVGFIARACAVVPPEVELGIHLCYGSPGNKHIVEPADAKNMVCLSNKIFATITRRIDWLHIPVPISRTDEAYFEPLQKLKLPEGTELYLGLVHPEDGVEGAERRIKAAKKFVDNFGIGTECGMRFYTDENFKDLLGLHRKVAELVRA